MVRHLGTQPVADRSPCVRGSRHLTRRRRARLRSIPVCAGEPACPARRSGRSQVDPRVCGGAALSLVASVMVLGRSPRVRGSLRSGVGRAAVIGSIPACVGEPHKSSSATMARQGDPRVCGGAPPDRIPGVRHGAIPACAGEPGRGCAGRPPSWGDPRVCGGAGLSHTENVPSSGRSPRVRGSPQLGLELLRLVGAIPACAGEPGRARRRPPRSGGDPRVCGGAVGDHEPRRRPRGRSPRVRGSRRRLGQRHARLGAIPACAGEPTPTNIQVGADTGDPRVCGGAP